MASNNEDEQKNGGATHLNDSFPGKRQAKRTPDVAALVLLLVGVVRIASTYTTFSETADEPVHVNAGLELLTIHTYDFHLVDPPLPRIFFAVGPMWMGARAVDFAGLDGFFRGAGHYPQMLAVARCGNLPFFILAAWATWAYARLQAGSMIALIAMALFTTQPAVLGYFALATHDGAATAGVALAMLACARWIDRPTAGTATLLGFAYGLAIACKLSCIAFVPVVCVVMCAIHRAPIRSLLKTVLAIPIAAAFVVAAAYGFVLVPRFIAGVADIVATNRAGYLAYFWGRATTRGFWLYFPATFALKSTLPSLALLVAGCIVARRDRLFIETAVAGAAMILLVMPSNMDLGIRYILPIFAPFSVAAAVVFAELFWRRGLRIHLAAAILALWHLGASAWAHPDYFPYFNELAQPDPSLYLIDSNLDWGQDILRLSAATRQLKIDSIGVALFSITRLDYLLPPRYTMNEFVPVDGWIAISDHVYRMNQVTDGGWRWLRGKPFRRIGKSIRLYHLPP